MAEVKKIKNILLVDDDPVIVKLLQENLSKHGFDVKVTTDAPKGLQMAMDLQPDLIILDVMMPIINGYNFCKLLKTQEKQKVIPVILLTSRDEKEDIEIGLEMGADAYLTKPLHTEELLRTIKLIETMGQKS